MLPMSTAWPWSSPACATSGIRLCRMILIVFLASALFFSAQGSTIQAGADIQAAINAAKAGDTILVGPGDQNSFEVDKPLTIVGQGGPVLHAVIQRPAIKIICDGTTVSGFKILGVGKDSAAKFNYYMDNPAAAAGQRLDQPNAAIVVSANDVSVKNITIFGSQAGVQAEEADNLLVQNATLESCDSGVTLLRSSLCRLENCRFSNCRKYGLNAEKCDDLKVQNSSFVSSDNAGFLLKESDGCQVQDNVFSGARFGLSLWNASFNQVRRNRADHNYYGILITYNSNDNIIEDNVVEENRRNEIVKGFGIGISLQENSSDNLLIRNTAKKNFNGLEVSKGCKLNVVFGNNASENNHGIRLNENRNNLIFANNFYNNNINAYENASLNIWNTTIGNYYSDYHGKDENGNGIGDQPYALPGQDSESSDFQPLIKPYRDGGLNLTALKEEVRRYARYGPADEEIPPFRMSSGTIVISSRVPTSPPKWSDSKPLDINGGLGESS
ncbi:Right handed beta helix region [uncultured archaeon]|nr:Right handed beta helix region [uncultured archaeon]